jgi:hypothetical protein
LSEERKRGRLWIGVGEAAAVIAVIIAGLNYWDSRREHADQARRDAAQAQQAGLAESLVLTAAPQDGGRRLALRPADAGQVIQSQRYLFPAAVLDHPMDVTAAAPSIEAGWIAGGLSKALDQRHAKGEGRGRVPVGVVTTYLANGQQREDRAVYLVGYAWKGRLFGGRAITLEGVAFVRRASDLPAAVEHAWGSNG